MADGTSNLANLLAHADWLHRLAQQLSRDSHAAADAAQDALLSALQSPPPHGGNLRGYLARAVRNLLGLRARGAKRAHARERAIAELREPFAETAAAAAMRAELQQFLGRCVLALPEPQRGLVLLHYHEAEPIEVIAQRTGMTADAIRAHLRRARESLRAQLQSPDDPTVARAFAALSSTAIAWTATTMTLPIKSVTAAAVACLALLVWSPWSPEPPPATLPANANAAVLAQGSALATVTEAQPSSAAEATSSERTAVATTGYLHVRALWSDGTPAAAAQLVVTPDLREHDRTLEFRTDADGSVTVHDLPCAAGQLRLDWRGAAQFAITAGNTTELELRVRAGITVRGVVVDANGAPVPTARIWLSRSGGGEEGMEIATVERDGTFVLRDVPIAENFIAAIASSYRASTLTPVQGVAGSTQQVRIELREAGVSLLGRVRLHDGKPASGARVLVGLRENKPYHRESVWSTSRPPVETRCDARGEFRADGLAPNTAVPVWLCGEHTAPCKVMLTMPASGSLTHDFPLTPGATVHGRATGADGTPAANVVVLARSDGLFDSLEPAPLDPAPRFAAATTVTDANGHFDLRHVAPGTVLLRVMRDDPRQVATSRLALRDGDVVRCDPVLTAGAVIRGTVVDDQLRPLARWTMSCQGDRNGMTRSTETDDRGRFELSDCGDGAWELTAFAPDANYKFGVHVRDVVAGPDDLRIVVPTARIPCSELTGRVQLANGAPVHRALLWIWSETAQSVEAVPDTFNGPFRSGLLAPGVYRALAEQDGRRSRWTERVALRAGEELDIGTLSIEAGAHVEAFVRDANGDPMHGIECHVIETIEDSDTIVAGGMTKQGTLHFDHLRTGNYRLRTSARSTPYFDTPFSVAANVSTPMKVAVTIPASQRCILVTQPARRGAFQFFTFHWQRDGGSVQHTPAWLATREPTRMPRHLIPGDYVLTITHPTGARSENRFTVRADDPEGREIPIRLP